MIGTSFWEYVFMRASVFALRMVTPASICYTAAYITGLFHFPGAPLLFAYTATEMVFYLLVYLPRSFNLQAPAKHPERMPRERRRLYFERCAEQIPDPERYLSKWFHDALPSEIRQENLKDFFRWGFLNSGEFDPIDEEELDEYVHGVEKLLGREIAPGRGKAIPLRLTIDNFYPQHRPLAWYVVVSLVDAITFCFLRYHSFQFYGSSFWEFLNLFPFRPIALFTRHCSPSKTLTYWHRVHTSKTKPPILFIHGIGIGLWPYVNFLAELVKLDTTCDDGQVGIVALEIMPISFRITTETLPKEDMCREIQRILTFHGWDEFMLISHSYGSVISTYLLHDAEIAPKIGPIIFIDPVNFLLHLPDVAYNFTYRQPKLANEWQLYYMASKDLGVAHTLARHFFWSENILWREDVRDRRVTAVLAGRDLIVDTEKVGAYLSGADDESKAVGTWKDQRLKGTGLEVLFFPEIDHGQVFDKRRRMMEVVGIVKRYIDGGDHTSPK